MNDTKEYITEEGLKALQEKYDTLIHVTLEEVKKEIAEARSHGDLSENADYDAARERQSQVQAEIDDIERTLQNYVIINTKGGSRVTIGSTVTLQFLDNKEKVTYTILGTTETDPVNGVISNESPLAQAILDAKVADKRTVQVAKPYEVIIIEIKSKK